MAKIVYETGMKKMPDNCLECTMYQCNLATYRKNTEKVKKPYLTKRHKECPLSEQKD